MSFTNSIKLKLGVCFDCHSKTFTLSDQTGPWNATLNPFGWTPDGDWVNGTPIEDITSSHLTVTSPEGVVYGPFAEIFEEIPSLAGVTVTVDPLNIPQSIDPSSTNVGGQALTDGYWSFDWVVKGQHESSEEALHFRCLKSVLVLCDVECCVDRLTADSDPSCGCSGKGNKKAVNAMLTLEAVKAADRCGQKEKAKEHLNNLQAICGNNCKNC